MDDLDEEVVDEIRDAVFAMDDWDVEHKTESEDDERSDSGSDSSGIEDEIVPLASDFKQMFAKLDALMTLMFTYITDLPRTPSTPDTESDLESVFYSMIEIFETTILQTHRTKSAQFLLFYITSLDASFPESFMGMLVSHLLDEKPSSVIRVAATSYLGSFIARAKYLPTSSVRKCLGILNTFVLTFIDKHETAVGHRLVAMRYPAFYAAVQAILYIFCFHWRKLMVVDCTLITGTFPPELTDFTRVLLSKFTPLSVLPPNSGLLAINCRRVCQNHIKDADHVCFRTYKRRPTVDY
jgi:RNA polymerase I-specific transcription initiation factor RRN3